MSSLQRFIRDTSVRGSLSIDRVTFLVFSPLLSLWGEEGDYNRVRVERMKNLTLKLLKDDLDPDFPQGTPSELFHHHFRTARGVDVQFGPVLPKRKKVTDEAYIMAFGTDSDKEKGYAFSYSPNEYGFRVEYNPNESDLSSISNLLQYFASSGISASLVRIARLDIAVDYECDLNPALSICSNMRKSFIACGSTGIETVYFGSRASKNYVRIYNKAVELREKHNIDINSPRWRFELESKDSFQLDQVPDFSKVLGRFSFYSGGIVSDDWKLNLLLSYAKDNGLKAALSFLPLATAKRYKKLLDEFDQNGSIEPPVEAYYRDFPACFSLLRCQILTALGHKLEVFDVS